MSIYRSYETYTETNILESRSFIIGVLSPMILNLVMGLIIKAAGDGTADFFVGHRNLCQVLFRDNLARCPWN